MPVPLSFCRLFLPTFFCPVALSAYFLKAVVPEWSLKDIYLGMMQFMVIQLIGRILILLFPQIALWLPEYIYGKQDRSDDGTLPE